MKKKLLAAMLSSWLFIGAAPVSAAESPDVELGHWSYSAINELIATGKIDGYTAPIPSDYVISRIEIAEIINAAEQNLSAFNKNQRETIQRLDAEYFYYVKKIKLLNRLEAADDKITAEPLFTPEEADKVKKSADRLEISGMMQLRNDHIIENKLNANGGETDLTTGKYIGRAPKRRYTASSYLQADITAKYKINEKWKGVTRIEWRGNTNGVDDFIVMNSETDSSIVPYAWMEGKIGGGRGIDVKAGRWNEWTPQGWGYDMDSDVAAAQFSFGKPSFRTNITAGKVDLWDNYNLSPYLRSRGYDTDEWTNFLGVRWDWQANDKTDVHFGFHGMDAMNSRYQDAEKRNHVLYYYAHAGYKIDNNWSVRGGIINSNARAIEHPWGTGGPEASKTPGLWLNVWYKMANFSDPGSYDIFATYRKEPGLTWVTVTDWYPVNTEGFRVGVDYVMAKNMMFTTWAHRFKEIDTDAKQTRYRFQLSAMFD